MPVPVLSARPRISCEPNDLVDVTDIPSSSYIDLFGVCPAPAVTPNDIAPEVTSAIM